jgi:hypothetical protein
MKVRILVLLAVSLFASNSLWGQSSFSINPDTVVAIKPADYFVFYNYGQFENHTNDTLQMRWVRTSVVLQDVDGMPLGDDFGDWELAIQDPTWFYNPATQLDSANFILPPVTGSVDKFILQVFPNEQPGSLLITYRFFPVDNPSDFAEVVFDYAATEVVTTGVLTKEQLEVEVFPNPVSDELFIQPPGNEVGEYTLLDLQGREVEQVTGQGATNLQVHSIPTGIYLLRLRLGEEERWEKVLINR